LEVLITTTKLLSTKALCSGPQNKHFLNERQQRPSTNNKTFNHPKAASTTKNNTNRDQAWRITIVEVHHEVEEDIITIEREDTVVS